jgi:hypothetical protein
MRLADGQSLEENRQEYLHVRLVQQPLMRLADGQSLEENRQEYLCETSTVGSL